MERVTGSAAGGGEEGLSDGDGGYEKPRPRAGLEREWENRRSVREERWLCGVICVTFWGTIGSWPSLMTLAVFATLDSAATASPPSDAALDSFLFACAAVSGARHGCVRMRTLTAASPLHEDRCVFLQFTAELLWPLLLPLSDVDEIARVRAGVLGHGVWGSGGISSQHRPSSLLCANFVSCSLLREVMAAAACDLGATAAWRSIP